MEAKLFFGVDLEYDQTTNDILKEHAALKIWDGGLRKYLYIFNIEDKEGIESLTGKTFEIGESKYIKERIDLPKWKGKDIVEIKEFVKIYQIVEHRKQEDGKVKEIRHDLDRSTVDKIYEQVICLMPLNVPRKTSTVCERIATIFDLQRFFRATGSFDFQKFFGARKDYYRYFYLPMKVLVYLNKVKHYKSGKVERLK